MMDAMDVDSILFPFNFLCWSKGNFGPQILKRAKESGIARLAIKAMGLTRWKKDQQHTYRTWYNPIDDLELAEGAMRFALSRCRATSQHRSFRETTGSSRWRWTSPRVSSRSHPPRSSNSSPASKASSRSSPARLKHSIGCSWGWLDPGPHSIRAPFGHLVQILDELMHVR